MAKVTVGEMNRRLVFINGTYAVGPGGGVQEIIEEEFERWGNIKDISGSAFNAFSQMLQTSSIELAVRYDTKFTLATVMKYENCRYKFDSMDRVTEGYKAYLKIRCTKVEQWPGS